MERDAFVSCIRDDYDRFWKLLEKQVETCPEGLWAERVAGWYFWQQLYHAMYSMDFYTRPDEEPSVAPFSYDISMLSEDAPRHLSKGELLAFGATMKKRAFDYIEATTPQNMGETNAFLSRRLGKEVSRLYAVIAMIRHCNYHLGCCDAIFRERGLPGVY